MALKKSDLYSSLWASCDELRGGMDAVSTRTTSFSCCSSSYVEFFLLQDLVSVDCSIVKIAAPFDGFKCSPIPASVDEYNAYKNAMIGFIQGRNQRILRSLSGSVDTSP